MVLLGLQRHSSPLGLAHRHGLYLFNYLGLDADCAIGATDPENFSAQFGIELNLDNRGLFFRSIYLADYAICQHALF